MELCCTNCNETKSLDEFYVKKTAKNGRHSFCKKCMISKYSEQRKAYYKTYTRNDKAYIDTRVYPDGIRNCPTCKKDKSVEDYYYDSMIKNIKGSCKECTKEVRKRYYPTQNKKRRERLDSHPELKIQRAFQTRFYRIIKGTAKRSNLLSNYIGCSLEDFINWITYQFVDGMSLENYGKEWHLDHVRPCASFDLSKDEDILECMCWKNIRPCWKKENLTKSSKIDEKLITEHNNKVVEYLESRTCIDDDVRSS